MEGVPPVRDSPLVGRRPQLRRLTALYHRAEQGQAGAVLLAGDAGVGKTRLIGELIGQVQQRGGLTLVGSCVDLGAAGLAYLPFHQALTRLVHEPKPDPQRAAAAALVRRFAADRPALARLAVDLTAGTGQDDPVERLSLFDAVAGVLEALGHQVAPVLLVIEDLHWADASTRDLLRFLLTRLGRQRLLLLVSYRADDLHRRHPVRPLLAELVRLAGVERIDLSPFDQTELREYLELLHGGSLDAGVLAGIQARSQGNAFFAAELLAAGAGSGAGLPAALADVLLTRLDRLSPAALLVTRAVSVGGAQVPDQLLRTVCELPDPELDDALREAVARQLLVAEPGDRYGFRHALLQEAVYADLLPGERVSWHARYAGALTSAGVLTSAGASAAADLAHHCLASHDLPGALGASVRAGDHAIAQLAPAEAMAHFEQGLQLWRSVPQPRSIAGVDLADLGLRAAAAAAGAGELDRAVLLARQAISDLPAEADAGAVATARSRLAMHLYDAGDNDEARDEARAVGAALCTAAPTPAGVWAAAIEVRVAGGEGDLQTAAGLAASALVDARALGLAAAEIDLLTSLAVAEGGCGDPAEAVAHLEELRRRAEQLDDPSAAIRARYNLALALLDIGSVGRALDELDQLIEAAVTAGLGSSMYSIEARSVLVNTRYIAGDWEVVQEVVATARHELPPAMADLVAAGALLVEAARDPESAVHLTAEAEAHDYWIPQSGHFAAGARAEALTWLGDQAGALRVVRGALDAMTALRRPQHLGGIWLAALGLAALADQAERFALARDDDAVGVARAAGRLLLDDARARAAQGRPRLAVLGPEGRAWLARAEAEAARLRGETDPDRWSAVVSAFGFGHVYEQARSRLRWAQTLAAGGDRVAAAAELVAARAVAVRLAARPLRDSVDALARRARLDLGAGIAPSDGVLTRREHEVILLVAEGLTNRQIGQRLFISAKTASVHVSNVLAKLGVSGRAEAVDVAHRRGLLGG